MAYFKIEHYSDCQVGEIPANYHFWFYLDAEIGEPTEEYMEEGEEDGNKNFIPTFQKSIKKYFMETVLIPSHLIDAIHRLKFFKYVTVTTPIGDIWTMKNIKTEVNYPFSNKTYGIMKIEFDIDEVLTITGCCN
jgi:hypothetical protein